MPAAEGGGPYDAIATHAREEADARAVVLIILGGKHGDGFTLQQGVPFGSHRLVTSLELIQHLRGLADSLEKHELQGRSTVRFEV